MAKKLNGIKTKRDREREREIKKGWRDRAKGKRGQEGERQDEE